MRRPVRWYRTFQNGEASLAPRRIRQARFDIPVRWLHGMNDPIITLTLLADYADRASDFKLKRSTGLVIGSSTNVPI